MPSVDRSSHHPRQSRVCQCSTFMIQTCAVSPGTAERTNACGGPGGGMIALLRAGKEALGVWPVNLCKSCGEARTSNERTRLAIPCAREHSPEESTMLASEYRAKAERAVSKPAALIRCSMTPCEQRISPPSTSMRESLSSNSFVDGARRYWPILRTDCRQSPTTASSASDVLYSLLFELMFSTWNPKAEKARCGVRAASNTLAFSRSPLHAARVGGCERARIETQWSCEPAMCRSKSLSRCLYRPRLANGHMLDQSDCMVIINLEDKQRGLGVEQQETCCLLALTGCEIVQICAQFLDTGEFLAETRSNHNADKICLFACGLSMRLRRSQQRLPKPRHGRCQAIVHLNHSPVPHPLFTAP
eukprot:m.122252 g.122252  ORF g.122252 m.122252 type:complete len:361 (-) comp9625_c0_seq3:2297-3379(-)